MAPGRGTEPSLTEKEAAPPGGESTVPALGGRPPLPWQKFTGLELWPPRANL